MIFISLEFLALAVGVSTAGIFLARSADQIAKITRFGRLLIGGVLLAAATSLPELTVGISAVVQEMPDLAAGGLIGSSLMNLMILAVLDLVHRSGGKMLSRESAANALSGTLSIALTAIAGMAILSAPRMPGISFLGIDFWSWGILLAYLLGVRMIFLDQRISVRASLSTEPELLAKQKTRTRSARPAVVFTVAAIVIFSTGPRLAHVAGQLADLTGMGKTFVGTVFLAITTSLPELVASLTAMRIGAFDLVIGNVFGSNAFNLILFVPLDAVHPGSLFADISPTHAVTAMAVVLATAIATLGQLYHVEKRKRFVEPDALLMILILTGSLYLAYRFSH